MGSRARARQRKHRERELCQQSPCCLRFFDQPIECNSNECASPRAWKRACVSFDARHARTRVSVAHRITCERASERARAMRRKQMPAMTNRDPPTSNMIYVTFRRRVRVDWPLSRYTLWNVSASNRQRDESAYVVGYALFFLCPDRIRRCISPLQRQSGDFFFSRYLTFFRIHCIVR